MRRVDADGERLAAGDVVGDAGGVRAGPGQGEVHARGWTGGGLTVGHRHVQVARRRLTNGHLQQTTAQ